MGVCAVHCVCVPPSGFFGAISFTFVHGFQNTFFTVVFLRSRSAICNICSGRLKVKVTLESMMKFGTVVLLED